MVDWHQNVTQPAAPPLPTRGSVTTRTPSSDHAILVGRHLPTPPASKTGLSKSGQGQPSEAGSITPKLGGPGGPATAVPASRSTATTATRTTAGRTNQRKRITPSLP